jgi:hypothetical protein
MYLLQTLSGSSINSLGAWDLNVAAKVVVLRRLER